MASLYYPRTDSLLVALFNRVKAKTEKIDTTNTAIEIPEFFLGEDFDGDKKWQA